MEAKIDLVKKEHIFFPLLKSTFEVFLSEQNFFLLILIFLWVQSLSPVIRSIKKFFILHEQ